MPDKMTVSLPMDANNNAVQVAKDTIMKDGTGTPIESPLSMTTTVISTIIPPAGAINMIAICGADWNFGVVAALDEGYMLGKADQYVVIPCAAGENIYVRNDSSGTNDLYFYFEILEDA